MPHTVVDRDAFLQHLAQSGLLSSRDLRRVTESCRDLRKAKQIARMLVDWGLVTKFQAELLLIGRSQGFFLGPYKILDQVGQGGMGRVYRALHQTMNRVVALKVLAPHLVKTPKAQKLFQREVQAAAQLNHPNIITAYDANEINGRHFLAMEYVDGPNLEQLVREQGPLPSGMACEIIRQAANGLEHAHEWNLVHRDIKPANLLLQPARNGQTFVVKILDFGLARLHEWELLATDDKKDQREHAVMGTPDFLSPEQAHNLPQIDIRSDLYSLGCTFYFLLTGRVPFAGGTTLEKLLRHSSEEPATLELFRDDVPPAVQAIVKKLLAKKPAERFQTPQQVAAALAPYAAPCAPNWDAAPRAPASESSFPGSDEDFPEAGDWQEQPPAPRGAAAALSEEPLLGTVPPALAPTPVSHSDANLTPGWNAADAAERRRSRRMLLVAGAIAVALIGLGLAALAWLIP